MLKIDFHTHTAEDPQDRIRYTAFQLIDRAAALGYDALAVTNHNSVTDTPALREHARKRGLVFIPGIELTIQGCHVLVVNPGFEFDRRVRLTMEDLPRLRTPGSLFIAPHPFFIIFQSMRTYLYPLLPYFDAIEFASYHNRLIDFNVRAVRAAKAAGKPLVGTSDCHTVWQFGRTYSLVDAEKNTASIIAAVKAGRIEVRTTPTSLLAMAAVVAQMLSYDKIKRLFQR